MDSRIGIAGASDQGTRDRQPDRSVDRELIDLLRSHGPRECEALASYERLLEQVDDEGVAYLMSMILDDERRHHRTIEEMLNTILSFVWEVDIEPSTPAVRRRPIPDVHAETKRLLRLEREDAKELRALRRALRSAKVYSVHTLLAELMEADTAKHIAILEFLIERTKP
ncbi:MAG: hypothetical protein JJE52_06150 [Acidimicrobiia bacterium]|nr:hypothetical protein [Acidimicrobiia bacterium]